MRLLRLHWRSFAALAVSFCLLALVLMHPAGSPEPLLAAFVLLPVVLFGLVVVPRSFWPAADFSHPVPLSVRARASLFQRPPPNPLR